MIRIGLFIELMKTFWKSCLARGIMMIRLINNLNQRKYYATKSVAE